MIKSLVGSVVLAAMSLAGASAWAGPFLTDPDAAQSFKPSIDPHRGLPPGESIFDPRNADGGQVGRAPLRPSADAAPASPSAKDDAPPAESKPPTRKEMIDTLFDRLAKATDPEEATGIAGAIQHIWMHSGSDTADLLMSRALVALSGNHKDVALDLLDRILALAPDWAEAWNKRATLRFLDDDDAGSMEDISHVLALEPRHFGALSGMGFILKRNGQDKAALTALRKALEIYPESEEIKKAVDQLVPEVEGRDL